MQKWLRFKHQQLNFFFYFNTRNQSTIDFPPEFTYLHVLTVINTKMVQNIDFTDLLWNYLDKHTILILLVEPRGNPLID